MVIKSRNRKSKADVQKDYGGGDSGIDEANRPRPEPIPRSSKKNKRRSVRWRLQMLAMRDLDHCDPD